MMDIWMIWARDPESNGLYLVNAWDDDSKSENESGWLDDVAKAGEEHGAGNIRIARTAVNIDTILQAFEPVTV